MYDQLMAYPSMAAILKNKGVKMIQLERNNILDIYISRMVARNNKIWVIGSKDVVIKKTHLDPDKVINEIKEIKIIQDKIEKIANSFNAMKITYEDLVDNPLIVNNVFNYLAVNEVGEVKDININKTNKMIKSHEDAVSNWSEISEILINSEYSIYL